MLNYAAVEEAKKRIEVYIKPTRLEKSLYLSNEDTQIFMKLECHQPMVRSYKIRGAMSKVTALTEAEKKQGVTAISSGNHGAALAYSASLLKIEKAKIFVPETIPQPKVDIMESFGAEVIKVGKDYDGAHNIGGQMIKEEGLIEVHPCEDPVCIAGQGTIALEILQEQPDIDVIVVPIGGGGIITGISVYAKYFNKDIEIIGVQTEACPAMLASMNDKTYYEYYDSKDSVCDALIGGVSRVPYEMSEEAIDRILLISEEDIKAATKAMILQEKIVAEPSSTICYASISKYPEIFKGKKVALVITGGNVQPSLIEEIMCRK